VRLNPGESRAQCPAAPAHTGSRRTRADHVEAVQDPVEREAEIVVGPRTLRTPLEHPRAEKPVQRRELLRAGEHRESCLLYADMTD